MKEIEELDEGHEEDDPDEEEENLETNNFVCEECDYRWEDSYAGDDWESQNLVCPMCGSLNLTQL